MQNATAPNIDTQTKKYNGQSFMAVIVQTGSLDAWAKSNFRARQGRAGRRIGQFSIGHQELHVNNQV